LLEERRDVDLGGVRNACSRRVFLLLHRVNCRGRPR
jgi:hypothetical protein